MTEQKHPDIYTEKLFSNPDHTIAIYGSCASRDLFGFGLDNLCFVANQSLISTYSKPFDVADNFVLNSELNNWGKKLVLRDFHSDPNLQNLKPADTLIIDLVAETYGVFEKNGSMATEPFWFRQIGGTEYATHAAYRKILPNSPEYWDTWCRSADRFLQDISNRYSTKILNCVFGTFAYNNFHTKKIMRTLSNNKALKKKYNYLKRKGDFICITHSPWLMIGDVNNPWGEGPHHFRRPYYTRLRDKVVAIVNQD